MQDNFWYWITMILFIGVTLVIGLGSVSCPNEPRARDILEAEGFTNITTTGGAGLWSCSKGDGSATGFVATGPTGKRVDGVVCCGLAFKACTVRVNGVHKNN